MTDASFVDVFEQALGLTIETLVKQHHTVYPDLPPQGIYFEKLARRAFELCAAPGARIEQTTPNQPEFDLAVAGAKLCTTERDPWEAAALI